MDPQNGDNHRPRLSLNALVFIIAGALLLLAFFCGQKPELLLYSKFCWLVLFAGMGILDLCLVIVMLKSGKTFGSGPAYHKTEKPVQYWVKVAVYFFLSLLFLFAAAKSFQTLQYYIAHPEVPVK